MSTKHLDAFFKPRAIALIGASDAPGSIGAILVANLLAGGFKGPIMPVNPRHERIAGISCHATLDQLPQPADLGVICTPAVAVPAILDALGRQGARAAVVVTAGFAETREARGGALQRELLTVARRHGIRILGPNCVGILVPRSGLNASFAHRDALPGSLAFVSQSSAVITSVLDWAGSRGIGFSAMVSLGDMADIDFADMLDLLAADSATRAILLYMESAGDARRFMSAARATARVKPIVVVKAGRHAEGARAVASHTGALAGTDAVYQAAFDRAGILRVFTLAELFDAVEILALARPIRGERLAILTNGGGAGVLATDALIEAGGRLAELSTTTLAELDQILPHTWSHGNPIDLIDDADGRRYQDALAILHRDPGIDAILAMHSPTAVVSALEAAKAVTALPRGSTTPFLLASWVGNGAMTESRRLFAAHGIPHYGTPEQAVRAFRYLVSHRRAQELLSETPPSIPETFTPDTGLVCELVTAARAAGRDTLTEPEAKRVLTAYGIPVVDTHAVSTPEAAAACAASIGGPVVVKILSPGLGHKSDVGGVVLDLVGPAAVLEAARAMLARIRADYPEARIQGLAVQPMVRRPGAQELIVGAAEDPQFGPVILVGQGGTAVEAIADRAIGLPPLNLRLAHALIAHTRIHRVLRGVRGQPPADLAALALTLVRVAQLVIDVPEIRELDINPLLIDPDGVIALDARIALAASGATTRLAIRPYPKELEELVTLPDGRRLLLRPIRPEDEPALRRAFSRLTPEEVRLRFFAPMSTLSHAVAARLTQIDYEREMALILTDLDTSAPDEIHGVVRIIGDADNEHAEFAVIVAQGLSGIGLGKLLMRRILEYARQRGIREIFGEVLRENRAMLGLSESLGFMQRPSADDPSTVRVSLLL